MQIMKFCDLTKSLLLKFLGKRFQELSTYELIQGIMLLVKIYGHKIPVPRLRIF